MKAASSDPSAMPRPAPDPTRAEPGRSVAGGETQRPRALSAELSSLRLDHDAATADTGRRRPLLVVGSLLVLALIVWLGYRATRARTQPVQVAAAVAQPTGQKIEGPVLSGSGYVVTGDRYISIGVRVGGRIERYFVEEGQDVRAGDPLVALDDRDYRARLARAEAGLASARANLALHEAELQRMRRLFGAGVVSQQELDERESRVAVDRATIAQLEAEIAQAKIELEYTVLRAPRDGVILAKLKEVGEIAVPGGFEGSGDLIRMANLQDRRAEVDVNESDLRRVWIGQAAEVLPDAYPDRRYRAEVVKLYPQVNRQKGTLKVEARVLEPDSRLLPDMSVRVNFLAEAVPAGPGGAVVLVPRGALREDDGGAYVWLVRDERAHRQPVTVGTELGEQVQVTAGLSGGESLVVGDATGLTDGAAVRIETQP